LKGNVFAKPSRKSFIAKHYTSYIHFYSFEKKRFELMEMPKKSMLFYPQKYSITRIALEITCAFPLKTEGILRKFKK
jgi:hypothetical protein